MTTDCKMLKGGEFLVADCGGEDIFTPEDFTDEQKQIAETTEQFLINEVLPHHEEIENHNFDIVKELMGKCGELGLLMMDASEEHGGLELDKATSMLVTEKIAPSGSFAVVFAAHTGLATLPLIYYGTPEQKEKYLGKLISGEWIGAYCLTEPDSGSDALGAKATAVLSDDGTHYILNGTKQFITNAGTAELFTVFAQVDKEHFTTFLVERGFEGVSIGPEENKMGIKGSSTAQVILDNAKVPVENLLGEVGKGHKVAFNILNVGRFKLAASVVGGAKGAFVEAVKYANERKQFGKTIGSFGAIQEKIANMLADLYASESLVYRLSGLLDMALGSLDKSADDYYEQYQKQIKDYAAECGISKVFCSEVLARVVDETVQIHGGYGFVKEYPAERYYRDERINRIFEGTNEINRLLIPGMILKKSMRGELPLQSEAMKAFESLMTPSFDEVDDSTPFAKEKALLKNAKTLFLVIAGAASKKYMMKLGDEQEILTAAADLIINIFAMESALLRAEKAYGSATEKKQKLLAATTQVFMYNANEEISKAAKRAAYYIEEGDTLTMILSGIRRFTKYDATGLLESKRLIANAALEAEKYIFS